MRFALALVIVVADIQYTSDPVFWSVIAPPGTSSFPLPLLAPQTAAARPSMPSSGIAAVGMFGLGSSYAALLRTPSGQLGPTTGGLVPFLPAPFTVTVAGVQH